MREGETKCYDNGNGKNMQSWEGAFVFNDFASNVIVEILNIMEDGGFIPAAVFIHIVFRF